MDESVDGRFLPADLLEAWEVPAPPPDLADRILTRQAGLSGAPLQLAIAKPSDEAPDPVRATNTFATHAFRNAALLGLAAAASLLFAFFMGRESVPSTPDEALVVSPPPAARTRESLTNSAVVGLADAQDGPASDDHPRREPMGSALKRAGLLQCDGGLPGMEVQIELVIDRRGAVIGAQASGSQNAKLLKCVEQRARSIAVSPQNALTVVTHTIRF